MYLPTVNVCEVIINDEARANYASALRAYIESMMKAGMDACEIWCELELTLSQVEEIVSDLED